jgi:uncharacterized LabA/DUF88 family protein
VPGSTYIYIDALNFYYGAVKGTPHKWVDFDALGRALVPRDHIGRIKYFTANVKPLSPGDRTHERQNAFLRAVAVNPIIEIARGHFRSDVRLRALAERKHLPEDLFVPALEPAADLAEMLANAQARRTKPATMARVVIPEEKGSDVNLGTHLLYDALKGHCDKAVVITNDSDLREPIRLAVAEGIKVGVVNPHRHVPTNKILTSVADFEIPLRPKTVATCQMPNPVVTAKGSQIHKPKEW